MFFVDTVGIRHFLVLSLLKCLPVPDKVQEAAGLIRLAHSGLQASSSQWICKLAVQERKFSGTDTILTDVQICLESNQQSPVVPGRGN